MIMTKKETFLVIVPHPDDETNLTGNILSALAADTELYVVYTSVDTSLKKGRVRKKEGINACAVYGIPKDHVLFLNFPDTPNRTGHHFFQEQEGHRKVVEAIKDILIKKRPSVIFACDFDYHSDHRMVSLASEEAVREVVFETASAERREQIYQPCLYKGFCYDTAWFGPADYRVRHLGPARMTVDKPADPAYRWEERISLKGKEKDGFIWQKSACKALRCHRSQFAVLHARSVINADNVFWQRRTDNAAPCGTVTVSSGDGSGINDFSLIRPFDIITIDQADIDFSSGVWHPSDQDEMPSVTITFEKGISPVMLVLYGDPSSGENVSATVEINTGDKTIFRKIDICGGRSTKLSLCNAEDDEKDNKQPYCNASAKKGSCEKISICFREISDRKAFGLSEIEVFEETSQKNALIEKYAAEAKEYGGSSSAQSADHSVPASSSDGLTAAELINSIGFGWIVFWTRARRKLSYKLRK